MLNTAGYAVVLGVVFAVILAILPSLLYPADEVKFHVESLVHNRSIIANEHVPKPTRLNFIVTGANSGLGWGTAYHLAQVPYTHTVMACRSMEKCRNAKAKIYPHPTSKVTCRRLDLESRESIESFSAEISQILQTNTDGEGPLIHGLVNNAGIWGSHDVRYFAPETGSDIHMHVNMHVNHLGHFLLTHLLWTHLQSNSTTKARVVTVSSLVTIAPFDVFAGWFHLPSSSPKSPSFLGYFAHIVDMVGVYARSKRANLMFAAELHDRHGDKVVSTASHPGYTRTNIFLTGMVGFPRWIRQLIHWNRLGSMNVLDGAWTQVRPVLDTNLEGNMLVGPKYWLVGDAVPVGRLRDENPSHFWPFTPSESRNLWEQSLSTLGIKEFGKNGETPSCEP